MQSSSQKKTGFLGSSIFPSFDPVEEFPSFESFPIESQPQGDVQPPTSAAANALPSSPKQFKLKSKHKHKQKKKEKESKHRVVYHAAPNAISASTDLIIPTFHKLLTQTDSSATYYIDRRGDSQNVQFQSAARSRVPRYKLHSMNVYGLRKRPFPIAFRISHRIAGQAVVFQANAPKSRISYREYRSALRNRPIRLQAVLRRAESKESKSTEALGATEDFISFQPDAESAVSEELLVGSYTQNIQESPEFLAETAKLQVRLQNNPGNIQTWLDYLELQDTLLGAAKEESHNARALAALKKVIAEKKLAIYEKALHFHPTAVEKLWLPYLECGERDAKWSEVAVLQKWDLLISKFSKIEAETADLAYTAWYNYIRVRKTGWVSFKVTSVLDVFQECMDAFRSLSTSLHSELEIHTNEERLLHFFCEASKLLWEAGYTERAVALFQAQIEFSCFASDAFRQVSLDSRLEIFEEFWESESPRVGEPGAKGWKDNVIGAPGQPSNILKKNRLDEDMDEEGDPFEHWARRESEREFYDWLPARTNDVGEFLEQQDEENDDPYSTVIFDDVRPYIFDITSPRLKHRLICSFANLLSCPVNNTETTNSDGFEMLDNALLNNVLMTSFFRRQKGSTSASFPVKTVPMHLFSILDKPSGDSFPSLGIIDTFQLQSCSDSGYQRIEFIQRLFTQCQHVLDDWIDMGIPLSISLKASEEAGGLKTVVKLGKGALKENRMNLSLWVFYAGLEEGRGKPEEARKIYQTALESYRTFPDQFRWDAVVLHLAYAEFELLHGNEAAAFASILSLTDSSIDIKNFRAEVVGGTKILKAKKFLTDSWGLQISRCSSSTCSSKDVRAASYFAYCAALCEYLSSQRIQDGLELLSKAIDSIQQERLKELLIEWKLRMLLRHWTKMGKGFTESGLKPAEVRLAVERAVTLFPNNVQFWLWFSEVERRTWAEGRVKRVLDEFLKKAPTVFLWSLAVWLELHPEISGVSTERSYNPNTVQSLLSRATSCPLVGKLSPAIWRLSVVFEVLQGNIARAKQLLFVGVRECPWSKNLYKMCVEEVANGFISDDERAEFLRVMEEKEIRVRIAF